MELDHHIEQYFQRRYTNDEIRAVLAEVHGVVLSKRKLSEILREKIVEQEGQDVDRCGRGGSATTNVWAVSGPK